ncbi:MAG: WbqC family protein [Candidatus Rokuibacteriota bacterium]
MKLAIHQPQYLPWLGYLAKRAAADLFVYLDTVQYEKHGWQNRNRIKTHEGARWLTVPVHARLGTTIHDITIDTRQPWRQRHRNAIEEAYRGATHGQRYRQGLDDLYGQAWATLVGVAIASADWLAAAFGIGTPTALASAFALEADDATERLVALCQAAGADTYLAGRDGATYMDLRQFEKAGISVLFQRYSHPTYPQLHGNFVPSLSSLDLLLTHGHGALDILRSGDAWSPVPPGTS